MIAYAISRVLGVQIWSFRVWAGGVSGFGLEVLELYGLKALRFKVEILAV